MNDTRIASKAKGQLANFMGKVFTHFPKPAKRFVEECIYGIQASGDTKLSSIVRAIDDDIRPIYTEKRLSRNLDDDTLERAVAGAVLKDGARSVRGDTLLLVDPTEIRKDLSPKGHATFPQTSQGLSPRNPSRFRTATPYCCFSNLVISTLLPYDHHLSHKSRISLQHHIKVPTTARRARICPPKTKGLSPQSPKHRLHPIRLTASPS